MHDLLMRGGVVDGFVFDDDNDELWQRDHLYVWKDGLGWQIAAGPTLPILRGSDFEVYERGEDGVFVAST